MEKFKSKKLAIEMVMDGDDAGKKGRLLNDAHVKYVLFDTYKRFCHIFVAHLNCH